MELFGALPVVGVEADLGVHDRVVGSGELGLDVVVLGDGDLGEERLAAQAALGVVAGRSGFMSVSDRVSVAVSRMEG